MTSFTLTRAHLGMLAACAGLALAAASAAQAQTAPNITSRIEWGLWTDADGCQHWWADGGLEGYMLDRVNPKTGRPVCLARNTCLVANTDTLFPSDGYRLTAEGRRRLEDFFRNAGAYGYAIYGHTDSRASDAYNLRLSQRRADSVAAVAKSVGAVVERDIGFGEQRPVASNATPEGMQKNRRVEVVCYRWTQ